MDNRTFSARLRLPSPNALRIEAVLLALAMTPACDGEAVADPTPSITTAGRTGGDDDEASTSTPGTESGSDPGSDPGSNDGPGTESGSADPSGSGGDHDGTDSSGGTELPPAFDDEFDGNVDHLVSAGPWQRLFPEQAATMLEGEDPGFLSLTANAASVNNSWYFEYHGAALVKEVVGNFAIMTSITTESTQGGGAEPGGIFNSGGLLIRDVLAGPGNENWMTFNVGRQASAYGRELKKTVASGSNYFLNAQAQTSEHLLVCRLGTQFRFYHWDEDTGVWEAERFDNQVGAATTEINDLYDATRNPELDLPGPGESIELVFEFPTLSETAQVGVMMNSWGEPQDVRTAFDYIRMGSVIPRSADDCTAELTPSA